MKFLYSGSIFTSYVRDHGWNDWHAFYVLPDCGAKEVAFMYKIHVRIMYQHTPIIAPDHRS